MMTPRLVASSHVTGETRPIRIPVLAE